MPAPKKHPHQHSFFSSHLSKQKLMKLLGLAASSSSALSHADLSLSRCASLPANLLPSSTMADKAESEITSQDITSKSPHLAFTTISNVKLHVPIQLSFSQPNYKKWSRLFLLLVRRFNLHRYLDGSVVPTSDDDDEWFQLDALLQGWILSTITDEVSDLVISSTTSEASLWKFSRCYAACRRIFRLKPLFFSFKIRCLRFFKPDRPFSCWSGNARPWTLTAPPPLLPDRVDFLILGATADLKRRRAAGMAKAPRDSALAMDEATDVAVETGAEVAVVAASTDRGNDHPPTAIILGTHPTRIPTRGC
ncbi:unnamed protein product [Cuscuta campestris]|uniref:Retrotransposon Copia-like N-terminal domain-containing protein n=1 Tax=Cuscuta campestris TaxID=132261 RepID=A0A484LMK7_9ASTE|nr:unnamed protein product [Cuscuta campestris]